jgi:hypothetical protein
MNHLANKHIIILHSLYREVDRRAPETVGLAAMLALAPLRGRAGLALAVEEVTVEAGNTDEDDSKDDDDDGVSPPSPSVLLTSCATSSGH